MLFMNTLCQNLGYVFENVNSIPHIYKESIGRQYSITSTLFLRRVSVGKVGDPKNYTVKCTLHIFSRTPQNTCNPYKVRKANTNRDV